MLSTGSDGYTWDARNHLVSTLSGASFQYDPFGRRVSKTTSGATTNYLYDGLNPVQELSGGAPTANLLGGLAVDEHFLRTDGSGPANFLTGPLESTLALADSAGVIQTSYTYEPFGNTSVSGPGQREFPPIHRPRDRRRGAVFLQGTLLLTSTSAVHLGVPDRVRGRAQPL
jgi:YD repeat-containing protein